MNLHQDLFTHPGLLVTVSGYLTPSQPWRSYRAKTISSHSKQNYDLLSIAYKSLCLKRAGERQKPNEGEKADTLEKQRPELLTTALGTKDWKRIAAESSGTSTRTPNRSRDWTELNWTEGWRAIFWSTFWAQTKEPLIGLDRQQKGGGEVNFCVRDTQPQGIRVWKREVSTQGTDIGRAMTSVPDGRIKACFKHRFTLTAVTETALSLSLPSPLFLSLSFNFLPISPQGLSQKLVIYSICVLLHLGSPKTREGCIQEVLTWDTHISHPGTRSLTHVDCMSMKTW